MKIRKGFVSNSSSTSFCLYGIEMENDGEIDYDELFNGTDIEVFTPDGSDDSSIGRSLTNMKDEETFRQFKDRTEKDIKEKIKDKDLNFSVMEESWTDG